jgi:hypothetical protein
MSEDWKNDRAEAAMREGTEAIRKAAEEKAKQETIVEKTYTLEEIKKYILKQDSLGDVLYNLKNIDKLSNNEK